LEGTGKYSQREEYPLPELILLDLKMPRMDGFEVLTWIRSNENFKAIRVVVLTPSEEIYDVNKAYQLGANSFLVKPFEFENFAAMMRMLNSFWMGQSLAPQVERPRKKNGRKEGKEHR
jgi:CheY-like chemotaxis protein